jgi:hypothetical protein
LAFLIFAGWNIFSILFVQYFEILVIIPIAFTTLLLGIFYLGYRKGVVMVGITPAIQ